MASRQGSHWLTESPTVVPLCVTRPSEIFVKFFSNLFMLLAFTQSVDNVFSSFIVLSENEDFLISNLH